VSNAGDGINNESQIHRK